jgi:hypothetical protein
MTSVIRYVKNTMDGGGGASPRISSTGKDFQLVAFDVYTTAGIDADANADVLTWTGSGKIQSIVSVFMRRTGSGNTGVTDTGEIIPVGAVNQDTHSTFTVDTRGRTIKCSILAGACPIPTFTTISFLLVIGND